MVYFIHFPFQSDASYLSKKAGLKNYQNFNEENLTKLVLAVKSGNLIYAISKSAIDIKEKNSKKKLMVRQDFVTLQRKYLQVCWMNLPNGECLLTEWIHSVHPPPLSWEVGWGGVRG